MLSLQLQSPFLAANLGGVHFLLQKGSITGCSFTEFSTNEPSGPQEDVPLHLLVETEHSQNHAMGYTSVLQANLVHVLQSKLAVSTGGVKKHSKKGKKPLKATAMKGVEATPAEGSAGKSPSGFPSPNSSSPENVEEVQEPIAEHDSSSSHSSVSQQAGDSSHAADGSPNNSLEPERQKSASPVSTMSNEDCRNDSRDPSGPKNDTEAVLEDSIDPQGVSPVPSSTVFKRLVKRSAPLDLDSRSAQEAAKGVQGFTPSKATPNKRPREASCSSPAANSPVVGVEHHRGPEGCLTKSTPGKRRRSLLPQSTLLHEVGQ